MAKVITNINLNKELKRFEIKRETVNDETLTAVAEYYDMLNNPAEYKRYGSFAEAMEDVFNEA